MRSVTAGYNGGAGVGGGGLEVFRIRTATLSDAANPPDSTREGLSTMTVPTLNPGVCTAVIARISYASLSVITRLTVLTL